MILKISQNFQGSTCAGVAFWIWYVIGLVLYYKETLAQVFFCEFYKTIKNIFFIEHQGTTFVFN